MVGHATFCVVVVFNNVIARFAAPRGVWLRRQWILGLMAGNLPLRSVAESQFGVTGRRNAAFALSFDEIIVTTFTAGHEQRYRCGCSISLGDRVMYR